MTTAIWDTITAQVEFGITYYRYRTRLEIVHTEAANLPDHVNEEIRDAIVAVLRQYPEICPSLAENSENS